VMVPGAPPGVDREGGQAGEPGGKAMHSAAEVSAVLRSDSPSGHFLGDGDREGWRWSVSLKRSVPNKEEN